MVNPQKSQFLHFRPKSHTITNYLFKFGQVELSVVHQYKYLGVIYDEFCNFDIAARTLAAAGGRALGEIYCIKRKLSGVGFKTFTKLTESYIDPIVTYASSVWGLKSFSFPGATQNRAVRMFLGVHRFAPNNAINSDIGWRFALTKRRLCALRLWNKLCLLPPNRLCKQIFAWDHSVCHNNWCSEMKKLIILVYGDDIYYQAKLCVDIDFLIQPWKNLNEQNGRVQFSTYLNYVRISLIKIFMVLPNM